MTSLLELEDVHVRRGRSAVLRGLWLQVDRGQVVVVTGPNGAGKTTLVQAIAGILPVHAGRIRLDGVGIEDRSVAERARSGIGVTLERRRLFPSMTVRDNFLVASRTWGLGGRFARARIDELAVEFPVVSDKLEAPVRTLSGGQQQIVAIARSLLGSPDLLVLDEPSIGLSPGAWGAVVERCRALAGDGLGVLLVEQRVLDVTPIADRVLALHRGRARPVDPKDLTTGPTYLGGDEP